jgi:hypothetical protein
MGWIKRNLFFVIGGGIAVLLLGGAGFYAYLGWQRNNEALDKLGKIYDQLKQINSKKPLAGNDKVNNIKLANDQEQQFRQWIGTARKHFKPVAPIPNPPNGQYTSQLFGDSLSRTIARLRSDAADANVGLPPSYNFSFQAEYGAVKFAPGSLPLLSEQVGAVAAISEILFSTHVNSLESIQRVRVSDDDTVGQQNDYLNEHPYTNTLAVMTPYQVTFRAFTPEIAQALIAFASSENGTIVQSISVLPVSEANTALNASPGASAFAQRMGLAPRSTDLQPPPIRTPNGSQEFLNEQLLRVTMEIEVVRLAPGT